MSNFIERGIVNLKLQMGIRLKESEFRTMIDNAIIRDENMYSSDCIKYVGKAKKGDYASRMHAAHNYMVAMDNAFEEQWRDSDK